MAKKLDFTRRGTAKFKGLKPLMMATTVLVSVPLAASWAQQTEIDATVEGCALVNGVIPVDCDHAAHNTVVTYPDAPNTDVQVASDLGDDGFSIVVDAPPRTVGAGVSSRTGSSVQGQAAQNPYRAADESLVAADVEVKYTGITHNRTLGISTSDLRRTYVGGDVVSFHASSNYSNWIRRAEILVTERNRPNAVIARIPIEPNGTAQWRLPDSGSGDFAYSLRVYDGGGRFDQTRDLPITRTTERLGSEPATGPIVAPGEGEDMTRARGIPITGGTVTVHARNIRSGVSPTVNGEAVPTEGGSFVVERILPPGTHTIQVDTGRGIVSRQVTIPDREMFYVGIVDLTYGRNFESDSSYSRGRIAGYVEGQLANGWRIVASVDTREQDLGNLFDDLGQKDPESVIDRIRPEDVFATFGDDSVSIQNAPTSGRIYFEAQKDNTRLAWGDTHIADDQSDLARMDRSIYGLSFQHASLDQTSSGDPRFRMLGYAAQPDRLIQRDVFDATGGSTYFLGRRDISQGTESLIVRFTDPDSGNVITTRRLEEGVDYRINYYQGVVILNQALSTIAEDGSLITGGPISDYDVDIVAQYEYAPTSGEVDGYAVALRGEGWVNDNVRLGASYQRETTGVADTELKAVDALVRYSDATYVTGEYAVSNGPGFGSTSSLNAGMDIDNFALSGSSGVVGVDAKAYRVEARVGLDEITDSKVSGVLGVWYDHKEEGFVSLDYDIGDTQTEWGAEGYVDVSSNLQLTFGYKNFEQNSGKMIEELRGGVKYQINPMWLAEVELERLDKTTPGDATQTGSRTDAALRVTYEPNEDMAYWAFIQGTVSQSGGLSSNDRYGLGGRGRVSDSVSAEFELSDGELGFGAAARIIYDDNAGSQYYVGYTLDPDRTQSLASLGGGDNRGRLNFGGTRRVNDAVMYNADLNYDAFGERPSLTSTYGVAYMPSDNMTVNGNFIYGREVREDGTELERRGISTGITYREGDRINGGLRLEYSRDSSDQDPGLNRKSYALSGFYHYKVNDDWRFVADADAVFSEHDTDSFRDGRYVDVSLGYAYRPVDNERFNALVSYTYLDDKPGVDQVNAEGDSEGSGQRSHILNATAHYDIDQLWSVSGKYGYRSGTTYPRDGSAEVTNNAHLLALRADFHVVSNWDLMAEGRLMAFEETSVTEQSALIGAWRHVGNNVKVGVGYQWGNVSDDLRTIESDNEGVFLNIVGKF